MKAKRKPLIGGPQRKIFIIGMLAFPVAYFLVFNLYINFDSIVMVFQRFNYSTGKIEFYGFGNIVFMAQKFVTDRGMGTVFVNSLLFFPVTNFITLPISVIFAYILTKKLPLYRFYRTVFFLPQIISVVVLTMVFGFMFDSTFGVVNPILRAIGLGGIVPNAWLGNKNTALPMVFLYCIWAGIGMNVVLVSSAIRRVPEEILEYGKLEGIGMFRELFSVIVPMIWPTITTMVIIGTTVVFTLFIQPLLLTNGGPDGATTTIALVLIQNTMQNNLNYAATLGLFLTLVGVILVSTVKAILDRFGRDVEY